MTFCMQCGHPLVRKWLEVDGVERQVCSSCGYVHYDNPKLLVWCFAYWQHRIVMCRRAHEPARGLWNPPAGFVEAGETLEEAISREAREEAGLHVPPSRFILYRVSSIPHMNQVHIGFRTELSGEPILVAGPEVSEVGIYAEADPPLKSMAFSEMLSGVPQDFYRFMRTGNFPICSETVRPVQRVESTSGDPL